MSPSQVLRDHRETLLGVMETFVHDPLVEWTQGHRSGNEIDNPHAKDAMATIEGLPSVISTLHSSLRRH